MMTSSGPDNDVWSRECYLVEMMSGPDDALWSRWHLVQVKLSTPYVEKTYCLSDSEVHLVCRALFPYLDSWWKIWWTVDGKTLEELPDRRRFFLSNRLKNLFVWGVFFASDLTFRWFSPFFPPSCCRFYFLLYVFAERWWKKMVIWLWRVCWWSRISSPEIWTGRLTALWRIQ